MGGEPTEELAARRSSAPPPAESATGAPPTLAEAVSALRLALAGHQADLPDREAAEEQLTALDVMAAAEVLDPDQLRQALLLVLAALGSVSALADPLAELRDVIAGFVDFTDAC
ncbi:DUF5955 family protein [Streptomyces sp. XM4193]|uniref:DUF5955 family protein n=1 Tax=Streptomyces sp. XM4193 TaxID=2929782 RepID=UPI001FF788EC|nr:DUF5955 family protein [Streptomyces sp. XM4193]MCK1797175.1 DUF5955 family protein [Streptomyces sp. XM4193]